MESAETPFLEHTALSLTDSTQLASRAFSLTDAVQFTETLPRLIGVASALTAGLLFWALACLLGMRPQASKLWLWLNIAAAELSLAFLAFLLLSLKPPSSFLPPDNIFHLQHYQDEIALLSNALKDMRSLSPDFLAAKGSALSRSGNALRFSAVFPASIPVISYPENSPSGPQNADRSALDTPRFA